MPAASRYGTRTSLVNSVPIQILQSNTPVTFLGERMKLHINQNEPTELYLFHFTKGARQNLFTPSSCRTCEAVLFRWGRRQSLLS